MLPPRRMEWLSEQHEIGNHLDQRQHRAQHQRRGGDPEHRQKADALAVKADQGDGQEHHQRQHGSDGDMRGGRERHRDQAQHVRQEDEHEQGHDIGEELQAFVACHVFDHLVDEAVEHLGHRLPARGDNGAATGGQDEKCDQCEDGDSHPEGDVGGGVPVDRAVAEQRLDQELLHRFDLQAACGFFPVRRHRQFPSSCPAFSAFRPSSFAVPSMVLTPAAKPKSEKMIRKIGRVPNSTSSP